MLVTAQAAVVAGRTANLRGRSQQRAKAAIWELTSRCRRPACSTREACRTTCGVTFDECLTWQFLTATILAKPFSGTTNPDTISGGFGNDTLSGGNDNDVFYGEASINPLSVQGTEAGTAGNLVVVNNTTDTLYVYRTQTDGSVTQIATILAGQTYTGAAPLNSARVIGNIDGTEFYRVFKTPGTAAGTVTLTPANDVIDGGAGNDSLFGQAGADLITGGTGADVIEGGTGKDTVSGGDSNDQISGGDGDDSLAGGLNNDTIGGGNGADTIFGEAGADVLRGGAGNDQISGGTENDFIGGDGGNDQILGDAGDDTLQGSLGMDTIQGGDGNDRIEGGADADSLLGGIGLDTITGGDGDDTIDGGTQNDVLSGNTGADVVTGGDGDDRIQGDLGDDLLTGGTGNDTIYGDAETPADPDISISAGTATNNNITFTNLDAPFESLNPAHFQTVTIGGVPYLITTRNAFDGYVGVYRLEDNGSLTKTGSMLYQDGSTGTRTITVNGTTTITFPPTSTGGVSPTYAAFGNATNGVEVVDIGGTKTLFITSANGSGVTSWQINATGGLVYKGALQYGSSQPGTDRGITSDHEVITADDGKV